MERITLENNGIEETIHVAEDLNFKPKPQCKHHFKRVSSKKVECVKCGIGYMDNGDFPIKEINEFYLK